MFAFSFIAVLSLVPAFTFAQSCSRSYTVKVGDFCDSISADNKASTYQLAALNTAVNPSCTNLGVGQQLCLGSVGDDCQQTYVVKPGDICNSVMDQFKINATMLWANNPQINEACTNMYAGEVLCVASSVQVPPQPASGPVQISRGPPAPASTAAPPAQTSSIAVVTTSAAPAPTQSADDDDDSDLPDCDDDDDEESSAAPPAPTASVPVATSSAAPAPTTPPTNDSGNDGDDDDSDLPFCDEIDD